MLSVLVFRTEAMLSEMALRASTNESLLVETPVLFAATPVPPALAVAGFPFRAFATLSLYFFAVFVFGNGSNAVSFALTNRLYAISLVLSRQFYAVGCTRTGNAETVRHMSTGSL